MSETEVTVLGVTVDDKLYFSQHIGACCKKVARVIFPLVWHFCGQVNKQMFEKIKERALRILFTDYNWKKTEKKKQLAQTLSWYNDFV